MTLELEREICVLKGKIFTNESILCDREGCLECKDGEWDEEVDWSSPKKRILVTPEER
ncbi:MAG: hypothetical protein ACLGPL_00110 [Acidobacteriota bacterium]